MWELTLKTNLYNSTILPYNNCKINYNLHFNCCMGRDILPMSSNTCFVLDMHVSPPLRYDKPSSTISLSFVGALEWTQRVKGKKLMPAVQTVWLINLCWNGMKFWYNYNTISLAAFQPLYRWHFILLFFCVSVQFLRESCFQLTTVKSPNACLA